jgi:hypothetical protein
MLRTVAIAGTLACSAQGRTAERVMIHADSRAINRDCPETGHSCWNGIGGVFFCQRLS